MMDQILAHLPMVAKYSGAGLTVAGLVVFGFLAPVWVPSWSRRAAFELAGAVVIAVTLYSMGVRDEHRAGVAAWNAQVDREIENAAKDRTSADADVDRAGDDGMRNDPDNRRSGAIR